MENDENEMTESDLESVVGLLLCNDLVSELQMRGVRNFIPEGFVDVVISASNNMHGTITTLVLARFSCVYCVGSFLDLNLLLTSGGDCYPHIEYMLLSVLAQTLAQCL